MLDGRSGGQCGPPIGHHSIKIFGMYCAPPPPTHPLFFGEPRVVQPTVAYEIDRSVRQRGPHIGGDRLNESAKLRLVAPDSFLCLLCLGYIDDRPGKLELIASTSPWFRQNMQMLYTTVGKEQAIRRIEGHSGARCSLRRLKHKSAILGMNPFYDPVKRYLLRRIVFEYAVGLLRPHNLAGVWCPPETACVTESLGFGQIGFA